MKNILFSLLLALLLGCSGPPPIRTGLEGKKLPSFNLLLMDSATKLNTDAIPAGKPIVLLYFSPECPFCQAETEEIVSRIQSLSDIRFYFFTPYPFGQLRNYYSHYELEKYPNITVGRDYTASFGRYFKTQAVPYMAIYNKDKRLKQVYIGKLSAGEIKDIAF